MFQCSAQRLLTFIDASPFAITSLDFLSFSHFFPSVFGSSLVLQTPAFPSQFSFQFDFSRWIYRHRWSSIVHLIYCILLLHCSLDRTTEGGWAKRREECKRAWVAVLISQHIDLLSTSNCLCNTRVEKRKKLVLLLLVLGSRQAYVSVMQTTWCFCHILIQLCLSRIEIGHLSEWNFIL